MTTLRVRLAAPSSPDRVGAWALFDAAGACVRTGLDRPEAWPRADAVEVVLAASQLRIASVMLPPLPPSRVAGAARFALEDQLAGHPDAHFHAVSAQAPDGRVRVVVVARSLVGRVAESVRGASRIIAESDLAPSLPGWRWCAGEQGDGGFVCRPDGSAFPVDAPDRDGALPAELALALVQAQRGAATPLQVRVDGAYQDEELARWQNETGIPFVRGTPWRWQAAPAASFAAAIDLTPSLPVAESGSSRGILRRAFAPALLVAGAALALHVIATVGDWASLRLDNWRAAREWTALAAIAGAPPDAATTPASAREAIARRYAELRHGQGLPAWDDALPLLARAAPALAALPPGAVKSATYADRHWTLDLARTDPAVIGDLDVRMRGAGVPALVATSAAGTRLRFGAP